MYPHSHFCIYTGTYVQEKQQIVALASNSHISAPFVLTSNNGVIQYELFITPSSLKEVEKVCYRSVYSKLSQYHNEYHK